MAKVSGAIRSLLYGVSEQPPHRRLEGQHGEVVNFTPHPVHGLSRRAGSTFLSALPTNLGNTNSEANAADGVTWRSYDFNLGGTQYTVYYRSEPAATSNLPAMQVYNHTTKEFVASEGVGYPDLGVMDRLGYSSCTQVGKFLVFSVNNFVPTFTKRLLTGTILEAGKETRYNVGNFGTTIWIKSGQYGKDYTVKIKQSILDGVTGSTEFFGLTLTPTIQTFTYTTPKAQYDGVLDTSYIPQTDPEYQKKVNDAVHAYNTAVNQYTATASKAILPENIAKSLGALIKAHYGSGIVLDVYDEYISIYNTRPIGAVSSYIDFVWRYDIDLETSGASTGAMVVLANETESIDNLTAKAPIGKVVKISPARGSSYYLMAYPVGSTFRLGVDDLPTATGFRDPVHKEKFVFSKVVWKECPEELIVPDKVLVIATIGNDGKFYWGVKPALLQAIVGFDVPSFAPNKVGDKTTSPIPVALTVPITFLTTLQGRLVICGGGGIALSRSKDYFDFFLKSALTITDDDPIDATVNGAEGDTLHSGASIGKDLLLFGNVKQYTLSGTQLITPKNFSIVSKEGLSINSNCPLISVKGQLLYTQTNDGYSSIGSLSTGDFEGDYKSNQISQQLIDYTKGTITGAAIIPDAQTAFFRLSTRPNSLVVLSLLNDRDSTVTSYHEWSWSASLGTLIGITAYKGKLRALYLRKFADNSGYGFFMDEFSLSYIDGLSPLLDSKRTVTSQVTLGSLSDLSGVTKAVSNAEVKYLASQSYTIGEAFVGDPVTTWIGYEFNSSLRPTSLYIKDGKEVSILDGRTVVNTILLHLKDTVAFNGFVAAFNTITPVIQHHYRVAGNGFLTTKEATGSGVVQVPVGREVKEYELIIESVGHLPFTITALEWQGHLFTNRR